MNPKRDGTPGATRAGPPTSVPEIGRLLRRARTRQGLNLEDVSARTGLPLHLLEALEAGTVARIPDSVTALKALRRYADAVGLAGDRFVVAMVEHWPAVPSSPRPEAPVLPAAAGVPGPVPGNTLLAGEPTTRLSPPPMAVRVPSEPSSPAIPFTSPLPLLGSFGTGGEARTAQVPALAGLAGAPTQTVPAAPSRRKSAGGAGGGTPAFLIAAVVVLAVVVLAGLAVLVLHRYRPNLFGSGRTTAASSAAGGTTKAPGTGSTGGKGTTGTTDGTSGGGKNGTGGKRTTGTTAAGTAPVFSVTSSAPTNPAFAVTASAFEVKVEATGGAAWVEATQPGKAAPTFAGTLAPGHSDSALVTTTLTLTAGSVAAHVVVSVGGKVVGTYVPVAAPCTMTFRATPPV